ncbi:MAG: hypothetical protein V1813_04295 [Candidatus Aenigmatarchaeota archaeon]
MDYGRLKIRGIVEMKTPEGGIVRLNHIRPIGCKKLDTRYSHFLNTDIASFSGKEGGSEDGIVLNLSGAEYADRDRLASMLRLKRRYGKNGKDVYFVVDSGVLNSIKLARLETAFNAYPSMGSLKNDGRY